MYHCIKYGTYYCIKYGIPYYYLNSAVTRENFPSILTAPTFCITIPTINIPMRAGSVVNLKRSTPPMYAEMIRTTKLNS